MADIKFCENNYSQGVEEVISKLKDEGIDVDVESCLGYCGDCASGPFALVNDEFIQAETTEDLYDKVKDLI
jgi:uncharacterized protein YuzB (UPF0349 family)